MIPLRLIVNAIAVITAYVPPGIHVNTDIGPLLLVALIFASSTRCEAGDHVLSRPLS